MPKDWFRLDTAGLIFPAIARRDWCNVFRFSATLKEDVDPAVLQAAVNDLQPRFPSFYVTLHRGFFWNYLQKKSGPVTVREDFAYPLTFMGRKELHTSCLRVFFYRNRIAAEFFHSLTDGTGGSIYVRNLVARYLERKHGISVPADGDVIKDLSEPPRKEELEDSFFPHAARAAMKEDDDPSMHLTGTKEAGGFRHLITGVIDTDRLLDAAHQYHVSVTAFLAAVMAESVIGLQADTKPFRRWRPVRISIPVDLRRLFGSKTLRNFALVVNPGVDPRFGDYTFEELCRTMSHQIASLATRQNMAAMIAANVKPQQVLPLRLAPLPIKMFAMELVYRRRGEIGGSLNVSNLGNLFLPEVMKPYVERLEFIIGPQRSYPNNCSVASCGGVTCINMIRGIRESGLERRFFSRLVELGVPVSIESND